MFYIYCKTHFTIHILTVFFWLKHYSIYTMWIIVLQYIYYNFKFILYTQNVFFFSKPYTIYTLWNFFERYIYRVIFGTWEITIFILGGYMYNKTSIPTQYIYLVATIYQYAFYAYFNTHLYPFSYCRLLAYISVATDTCCVWYMMYFGIG